MLRFCNFSSFKITKLQFFKLRSKVFFIGTFRRNIFYYFSNETNSFVLMTVPYSSLCQQTGLTSFLKLLLHWRGSIFKLMYKDMIIYLFIYTILSFIYRVILNEEQRTQFEKVAIFCDRFSGFIPLTFVLGFYVTTLIRRWWNIFSSLMWIDKAATMVSCYIHGYDDKARLYRRTIMRYLNLSQVFVLRDISASVKKRYPTYAHMVKGGFITEEELSYMELEVDYNRYWLPLLWCCVLISKARGENYVKNDYLMHKINSEIMNFQRNLLSLINYDWICIPLGYTQVVTMAVYSFFAGCLMGRQYLNPKKNYQENDIDLYVPIFLILQFLFLMGWLKVCQTLLNPMGEDDDDFELNFILDRNLKVGYMIVDDNYNKHPELKKDMHWNEIIPELPYTLASVGLKNKPFVGSAVNLNINKAQEQIVYKSSYDSISSRGSRYGKNLLNSKKDKTIDPKLPNFSKSVEKL